MRLLKFISAIAIMLLGLNTFAQKGNRQLSSEFYFYNNGTPKHLDLNTKYAYAYSEDRQALENLDLKNAAILGEIRTDHSYKSEPGYYAELKLKKDNLSAENYLQILSSFQTEGKVYVAPYFKDEDGGKLGLSNYLHVKLKDVSDIGLLNDMAKEYNLTILPKGKYQHRLWFTLKYDGQNELNALDAANALSETGKFTAAVPDLMTEKLLQCTTNDSYFSQQWGLQNTGQSGGTSGVDINICDAWGITTGSSTIKTAVFGTGFQMDHPDLQANVFGTGWDAVMESSPSLVLGGHGTNVAGIIGARRNNSIGISGVAPSSKLISISAQLYFQITPDIVDQMEAGIRWAYQNGADIINNSWSSNNFPQPSPITDAIHDAVTSGRNGKGTVVVFSSGNDDHPYVNYPSYLEDVIAVGAISPCAERLSPSSCDGQYPYGGTNYGDALDIMAPGTLLSTTDLTGSSGAPGDYTTDFGETSGAAPHVAGVAALMLSVNPCMTEKAVRNTIEATAQKLGSYSYSSDLDKPNGTWHSEMGYGVVDAYKAVKAAQELYSPTSVDLFMKDAPEDFGAEPGSYPSSTPLWESEDIWTRNSLDGIEQHQNIVYNPGNPKAYVYVRVRNKSCLPSLGTETVHVYFSKGGPYANWPAPWTNTSDNPPYGREIGMAQIPVIPAGEERVIPITWNNVPNPQAYISDFPAPNQDQIHHFCILARIVAANDPMHSELIGSGSNNVLAHNLSNNNNVVMKNMNIINFTFLGESFVNNAAINIGNLTTTNHNYNIHFAPPVTETGNPITGEAEVKIILDNIVWQKWQANGAQGSGIRILNPDAHELLLTGPDAYINNLSFNAGQLGEISLQFNFLTEESTDKTNFAFDVTQVDYSTGAVINGSRYLIIKPKRTALFLAAIDSTSSTFSSNNLSLTAQDINEQAHYRWFTADTVLVDTGMSITLTNTQVIPSLLEITADTDGYKDYSAVNMTNLMNANTMTGPLSIQSTDSIISLTPNPATNQVIVAYQLSPSVQSASIKVTLVNNPSTLLVSTLNTGQSQKTLMLGTYPAGVYVVSLYCDGQLKDSKQLVIQ